MWSQNGLLFVVWVLAIQLLQLHAKALFDNPSSASVDYCEPTLCPRNKRHIACKNNGTFSKQCTDTARVLKNTKKLRDLILRKHNEIRNRTAGGLLPNLKPAARMATMSWDRDLAVLAQMNVRQCKLTLDSCRNTEHFPYVGQSVSMYAWDGEDEPVDAVTERQLDKWFKQSELVKPEQIQGFYQEAGKPVLQYTQTVQEASRYIGCSILREKRDDDYTYQYLTCNYSSGNVRGEQVYETSNHPATGCLTGKSDTYENLCSEAEKY